MMEDRYLLLLTIIYTILSCIYGVKIVEDDRPRIRECHGTHVGFGYSGDLESHYKSLVKKYEGCTHVEGNLEITNFYAATNITYDMSFLSSIEVVTGYVLLGLLEVDTIPLINLRLIRADNTYSIMKQEYGLIVAVTSAPEPEDPTEHVAALRELQLPSLREISRGKVLLQKNPYLCHVDTIDWRVIIPGEKDPVTYGDEAFSANCTAECDPSCVAKGQLRCWGQGYRMCQKVHSPRCHSSCPGRCYDDFILGCCHPECAVGCFGPFETDCMMCKYFEHEGRCVSTCPPDITYRHGQQCVDNPLKTIVDEALSEL